MSDHDDKNPVAPSEPEDRQGAEEPAEGPAEEPFDAVAAAAELEAAMQAAQSESGGGDSDRYIALLEEEIAQLNVTVQARDDALRAAEARLARAHDEIERAKRRLEGESERKLERRRREILLPLLEVLDELDRALGAARGAEHHPELVAGIELVQRRFHTVIGGFGVRPMSAVGEPFDPSWHEAATTIAVAEEARAGRVIEVLRQGFLIGEEVLRPAVVAVGRRP